MGINIRDKKQPIGLYVGLILVVAAIIRVVIFDGVYNIDSSRVKDGDTIRYERPALSLVENGNLYSKESPDISKNETLRVPPGYPVFIAGVYSVFGEGNRYAVVIAQIVVSIFSAWLLYLIAAQLWSPRVGMIAAALIVIDPLQIHYSQVLMSEVLLVPALLLFVLFSIQMMTNPQQRYRYALLMGISLAAATMIRPVNYYMIAFVLVGIALCKPLIGLNKKQLVNILMMIAIPYALIIGSWHIRNGELTGAYIFTDNQGALFLEYKSAAILAHKNGTTAEEEYAKIQQTMPPNYVSLAEKYEYEKTKALEIFWDNQYDHLILALKNLPHVVLYPGFDELKVFGGQSKGDAELPEGTTEMSWVQQIEQKTGHKLWYFLLMGVIGVYIVFIQGLFLYGIIKTWSTASQLVTLHALILGIVAFYVAMSVGNSFAYPRLRAPLMPFFVLYASYALSLVWDIVRSSSYFNKSPIVHKTIYKTDT